MFIFIFHMKAMANIGHRGLLEIEIDNQRGKLQKFQGDNCIIEALEKDKTTLHEEENRFFFTCKNVFLLHTPRRTVNCK